MIEYGTMTFKWLSGTQLELSPYFIFAGIVLVVMGYWVKKIMGAFIVFLSVVLAYLYLTGSFSRIM